MLLSNLNLLATAPSGVARLRELILTLAVQGKLVPQDPKDEPASKLLKKIRAEKDRLIAAKTLKREKEEPALTNDALPFDLPASWSWAALGEVIDIVRGITFPATQKTREAAPGRIACLRTSNVQQTIEWEDLLFVDRAFMGREDQLIQHHDIVMSMANSRELVGKVALIDQSPHVEATFGGFLGVLRPRKIDPRYAMAVLRTPYARSLLIDSSSQTTNIANVSLAKLRPLPFPLPPEAEQSRIVTRVEELMRLCDALETKGQLEATQHAQLVSTLLGTLTDSETPEQLADNWHRIATHFDMLLDRPEAVDALEQTILQLAVRGLLVPQDPQDEPAYTYLQRFCDEVARRQSKDAKHVQFQSEAEGLPVGWCMASVASVADCLDFMRKPVKKDDRQVSGAAVPYYGANGQVGWIEDFLFDEDLVLVVEDETFIGRTKPFSYIVRGKSWVNNHAHVLRPLAGMNVDYLNLCLQRYDFIPLTSGTTNRRKLTKAGLLDAQFMVAPLAEQSRIVTRVAQLRHLCADLRQRLTASRSTQAQLAEALVQEVA